MRAYQVPEPNKTSQTRKYEKYELKDKKKAVGVLKNLMQEDQRGCKKNNIRAEEELIIAARTKQHEDEEKDTGTRSAGRPAATKNRGTKRQTKQKEQN